MEDAGLTQTLDAAAKGYWERAVGPLHNLTWETLSLFAILLLSVALIATVLIRYSWVWSKPVLREATIKFGSHLYQDNLRLNPDDYLAYHNLSKDLSFDSDAVKKRMQRDASRYYLVTVVEKGRPIALVYREMRLQVPRRNGRVSPNSLQLDETSLTEVRLGNSQPDDDDATQQPAPQHLAGSYNIYIRPVRWYDVRHWLLHPNREIRIVVWVTLITTTVPVLLDLLFG
ncbi:MAG: hypothetical protein ABL889_20945 [Terricaulis sp.]